jgi:hypothetical protein
MTLYSKRSIESIVIDFHPFRLALTQSLITLVSIFTTMLPSNLLFKSCRSFRRFSNVTTSSGSYTSMPAIDKKDAAKNSKYAPGQSKYTPKPVKEIPLSTLTLSFSSWFCVPDQGMTELEVLCRATGFLVKANNTMENRVFHSHLT